MRYSKLLRILLVDNYMTWETIGAIVLLFTGKSYVGYVLTPLMLYSLAFVSKIKSSDFLMNIFFVLLLSGILVSWFINVFDHQEIIIVRCIGSEVAYMMAYLIGCSLKEREYDRLFQRCLLPVAILSIIGVYMFFFPPTWYLNRMSHMGEQTITLEGQRMKSIFSSPYTLSYISCVLFTYALFKVLKERESFKKYRLYIIIQIITLLLCMQRAPLGGAIIGLGGALTFYTIKYQKISYLVKSLVGLLVLVSVLTVCINNSKDERMEYLKYKIETVINNNESDFINSRYNINYMTVEHTLLGDGAGKHAAWANQYNYVNMADGQYKKIMQERGDLGFVVFVVFMALVLIKCVRFAGALSFELCVMLFLLVSMIGANPLTQIHPYLFWIIIGRISAFNPSLQKKEKFVIIKI